ncbi:GNAT family N-acetyltransferase [Oleidesulfovibrio sp.]|uniref:GNAT family N-acetyltransferase n=1 Tax=Oleidesulfovibrio sp. TaxID=2909707 RepID=UPI003A8C835E
MAVSFRRAEPTDFAAILDIHLAAFPHDPSVAEMVQDLLNDPSALPALSVIACNADGTPIGHILFTAAHIEGTPYKINVQILAPLAIIPEMQSQGIGTQLISYGLQLLKQQECELVFVLGHPDYYPRCGFAPAARQGFHAPYPIPEEVADAWMMLPLKPEAIIGVSGTVRCAKAMDKPEHWRE